MCERLDYWHGLDCCKDPELIRLMQKNCSIKRYSKNESILSPGDKLIYSFYVAQGVTEHISTSEDGREKVLYRLGKGWFFSEAVLLNEYTSESIRHAISITDSTLYLFNKAQYYELLNHDIFVRAIIRNAVRKAMLLQKDIESIVFESTKNRLLRLLVSYSDASMCVDSCWHKIDIPFSHQSLAAILGSNRVTISRLIGELRDEGLLRSVNKSFQIHVEAVKWCNTK